MTKLVITKAAFVCARCDKVIYIEQDANSKNFIEPDRCSCSDKEGIFFLHPKLSEYGEVFE